MVCLLDRASQFSRLRRKPFSIMDVSPRPRPAEPGFVVRPWREAWGISVQRFGGTLRRTVCHRRVSLHQGSGATLEYCVARASQPQGAEYRLIRDIVISYSPNLRRPEFAADKTEDRGGIRSLKILGPVVEPEKDAELYLSVNPSSPITGRAII